MHTLGTLGVVVEVGPGSTFKIGDHVMGPFGVFRYRIEDHLADVKWLSPLGMTEYALMPDEKIVKLVYVFLERKKG